MFLLFCSIQGSSALIFFLCFLWHLSFLQCFSYYVKIKKSAFFFRKFNSRKCHVGMARELSQPSLFLLGGNTHYMNCKFIWRNPVCWKKSRAPFLSHHQNKPHRSSFLTQRSWLAPSRICFNILAFSQHWTPTLSVLTEEQAQTSTEPEWSTQWRLLQAGAHSQPPALGSASCLPWWPSPDKDSSASWQQQGLFSQTKNVPTSTSNFA